MAKYNSQNFFSKRRRAVQQLKKENYNDQNIWIRILNKIIIPVWNSFLGSLVKATIVVLLLLLFLFQIRPDTAHIYTKIDQQVKQFTETYPTIKAERIALLGFDDESAISFYGNTPLRINLDGCAVNGVSYSSSDWLVFHMENSMNEWVRFSGNVHLVTLSSASYFSDYCYDFSTAEIDFNSNQTITVGKGIASIEKNDGTIICVFDDSDTDVSPGVSTSITLGRAPLGNMSFGPFKITIINDIANGTQVQGKRNTYMGTYSHEVRAAEITSLHSIYTGIVRVTYSLNTQEYELQRQELDIERDAKSESELYFLYDRDEEVGELWGYITDGSISNVSLFPTFFSWFYSSALIAPVTIVTAVFSAIALFNKKKEQKEKEGSQKNKETKMENEEPET